MQNREISKNVLGLIFFCLAIYSHANEIRQVGFAEYSNKASALNSSCKSKGMAGFSGFCLSQEYGNRSLDNPTQTSITIALGIASFEYFYSRCEHSEFSSASDTLAMAERVLDTAKYFQEIKTQREALENYVGQFYACKTKMENDAAVLKELGWFEYMGGRYSAGTAGGKASVSSVFADNKSIEYAAGTGNERLSVACKGSAMIDTACLIKIGPSGSGHPARFLGQPTRYGHLLRKSIDKALVPEQHSRQPSASDMSILRGLMLDQCHPVADSQGMSGDLLQLCIPADASRVVLFIRGLCDRCEFEPFILQKQAAP